MYIFAFRQPGSRWALEQAKFNLVNNYLLVGVTEELGDFIAMMEVILPRFFKGAMDLYLNGNLHTFMIHSGFVFVQSAKCSMKLCCGLCSFIEEQGVCCFAGVSRSRNETVSH